MTNEQTPEPAPKLCCAECGGTRFHFSTYDVHVVDFSRPVDERVGDVEEHALDAQAGLTCRSCNASMDMMDDDNALRRALNEAYEAYHDRAGDGNEA